MNSNPEPDPWALPDWREGAPNALASPTGPDGERIETTQDHRWLWHIVFELSMGPQNDHVEALHRRLRAYLNESCQHHWRDYERSDYANSDDFIPAHRQCLWCCSVEWADEVEASRG